MDYTYITVSTLKDQTLHVACIQYFFFLFCCCCFYFFIFYLLFKWFIYNKTFLKINE